MINGQINITPASNDVMPSPEWVDLIITNQHPIKAYVNKFRVKDYGGFYLLDIWISNFEAGDGVTYEVSNFRFGENMITPIIQDMDSGLQFRVWTTNNILSFNAFGQTNGDGLNGIFILVKGK